MTVVQSGNEWEALSGEPPGGRGGGGGREGRKERELSPNIRFSLDGKLQIVLVTHIPPLLQTDQISPCRF